MTKIKIEVEIPDYEIKYCKDILNVGSCNFLKSYGSYYFGSIYYCILTMKDITKVKGDRVCRPYGCRCLAKSREGERV